MLSETAALADVVLPVTQWAEETGTMTNLEGRVMLRQRAITPPAGVRSDLDVLAGPGRAPRLAGPVRAPTRRRSSPSSAARRRAARPTTRGITYDRIRDEHGVFWPCPTGSAGTPRMFLDRFATPDGRARFHAVDHRGPAEPPCARLPGAPDDRAGARAVPVRRPDPPGPRTWPTTGAFVELHPMLAGRIGVTDGDRSPIATRRGEMTAPARVVATIRPDTVFVPFHWVGANRLTNDALDPSSRMPEFKVCAAAVTAA